MTTRTATAVVVRLVTTSLDGEQKTSFYGPFLPHVGSATTTFIARLEEQLEESGRYKDWDTYVEDVFIGPDESDAQVTPKDAR